MSLPRFRQLAGLLVLAASSSVSAQSAPDLIGSWEAVRILDADGAETDDSGESVVMTFSDDGRLRLRLQDPYDPMGHESIKASYRIEGDVLVLVNEDGDEQRMLYRFEGDELALTPVEGRKETAYLRRIQN